MRDLLLRLQHALPAVESWIADLHRQHASASVAASALGLPRLAEYLPGSLLEQARAILVDDMPFPPVAELGLPAELKAMAAMPKAGVTFGHMYFLDRQHGAESTHLHELVHVVQWTVLSIPAFLSTYAVGIVRHGYEGSPLERAAFEMQGRFERREPIPELAARVGQHARQVADETAELFRSVGLVMSR